MFNAVSLNFFRLLRQTLSQTIDSYTRDNKNAEPVIVGLENDQIYVGAL